MLFFFNDTATTEIYTLSLHDALPILIHDLIGGNAPVRMKDERRGKCVSGQRERHPPRLPAENQHRSPNQFEEERRPDQRSEEHTSELQSRLHLVCRLLL